MERNIKLEVCCGDIESVAAANAGGADRIELCSALGEGGVTPSAGFIAEACRRSEIPVNVLIRPRGGDFVYTPEEVEIMFADIVTARMSGANGVVIGALNPDGTIDVEACRRLMEAAKGMSVTFHRAFDLCRDYATALEDVIALGCERILTSGQHQSALEGVDVLRELTDKAAGRIIILAGAGVSAANAAEIVGRGGVSEIHASARVTVESPMTFRHPGVSMGTPGSDEYSRKVTGADAVAAIKAAVKGL